MKRLIVVSMAIAAMILGSVFMVYVGIPLVSTHFHYERYLDPDETRYGYIEIRVQYANVTVRFEDDPTLLYRIDVVQYQPGWRHRVYNGDSANYVGIDIAGRDRWGNPERTERVDIVLGTGTHYDIYIGHWNLNVSVVYDNGVRLGSDELRIDCTGTVYFEFTEDVSFGASGLYVHISSNANATLVVDLPPGMNGRMRMNPYSTIISQWTYGWFLVDFYVWGTASLDLPRLNIELGTVRVSFHLSI